MKYYTHKPTKLTELTTQTVNFKRFYETPDGKLYPSITTVLSTRNKKVYLSGEKKLVMKLQTMLQEHLRLVELLSIICVRII